MKKVYRHTFQTKLHHMGMLYGYPVRFRILRGQTARDPFGIKVYPEIKHQSVWKVLPCLLELHFRYAAPVFRIEGGRYEIIHKKHWGGTDGVDWRVYFQHGGTQPHMEENLRRIVWYTLRRFYHANPGIHKKSSNGVWP